MRFIICDDEQQCVDKIDLLLKKYIGNEIYSVSYFTTGQELLEYSKNNSIDVAFLDIELKDSNGIEIAKQIKLTQDNCIFFFITNYISYIPEAFRLGSFQFLKKPISETDFKYDLERAICVHHSTHQKVMINSNKIKKDLRIDDIIYIEVYLKKITIHLKTGELSHSGNLNYYENKLKNYGFFKCHESFLVNLKYIEEFYGGYLKVTNKSENIPIGRKYKHTFLEKYNNYRLNNSI